MGKVNLIALFFGIKIFLAVFSATRKKYARLRNFGVKHAAYIRMLI